MFSIDPNGLLLEANDRWFEMTGHPPNSAYNLSWMELFIDSNRGCMEEAWRRLSHDGMHWSGELQLKKPWYDPHTGEEVANWVLAVSHFQILFYSHCIHLFFALELVLMR